MSALSRFLARHNIDTGRVASAAAGALLAVMAMTSPTTAKAEMPTIVVTQQNADVIRQSSERVDSQIYKAQQTMEAIREIAGRLTVTAKGKYKLATEAEAKYFGNAPHQDIAQYDGYLLKTAAEIPDGSSTADLLEQLNWQKAQLVQANRHLETMKDSFLEGNKEMRKEAMFQLTQLLINYNAQHVTISFDEKPVAAGEDGVFHVDMPALRQELAQSAPGLK